MSAAPPRSIAIVLLAAVAENGVIGRDNALPWRLSSDLQRFRALTMGKPVVMGRKTYLSIGKPLPGRTNIVVSRDPMFRGAGRWLRPHDLDAALAVARGDALRRGADEIVDHRRHRHLPQTMPLADRLEITHVHARPEGDTFFPPIDPKLWRETARSEHPAGPQDDAAFAYVTYIGRDCDLHGNACRHRTLRCGRGARCKPGRLPYNPANKTAGRRDGRPPRRDFMPWSNQGGGPWGSGGSKGPWGSGPQSSGPTPPDLEELLRRSQDKLRSVLPGGNLGGRGFALIALGAVVLWGVSGFFRVEPDEVGVVLRFGKYVREVQPGLNYHLPVSDRDRADAEGVAGPQDRRRHAHRRRPAPRHHRARRAGREPDAHRRREHRRRRFLGAVADQAEWRRRIPVQHPESRKAR